MTAEGSNLIWHGAETVEVAAAALARCTDVALHLPANFHHALVARLRSPQAAATVEAVDVTGGAELLARLGGIRGLEPVAALTGPAERAGAQVHVVSPAPVVAIRCRDSARARAP